MIFLVFYWDWNLDKRFHSMLCENYDIINYFGKIMVKVSAFLWSQSSLFCGVKNTSRLCKNWLIEISRTVWFLCPWLSVEVKLFSLPFEGFHMLTNQLLRPPSNKHESIKMQFKSTSATIFFSQCSYSLIIAEVFKQEKNQIRLCFFWTPVRRWLQLDHKELKSRCFL